MKITLEQHGSGYTLHSFSDGALRIRSPGAAGGEDGLLLLTTSCLIAPQRLVADWPPQKLQALSPVHLETVRELQPEVLLIGTGATLRFPQPEQLALLATLGVGYEVMDTAAACRTYNVLLAEGRQVAAALFTT